MKLYPDMVAEGTPEELAAFKHIDAALSARNKRPGQPLAIEGPSKPPKPKRTRQPKLTPTQIDEAIALAATNGGITARQMADYFHTSPEVGRKRLYRLRDQGKLWLTNDGIFKATKEAMG